MGDSVIPRSCHWTLFGRVPYEEADSLQRAVRNDLIDGGGPERLLLLEHPPVYTLGRNADRGDVVASAEWLRERSISIHESDRGGEVTYHGPGQLVGYPIIDLKPDRRDLRRYVDDLMTVLVASLAALGIEAEGRPAPEIGIWVGEAKIASLGIHLSRWVTTHGFAVNVGTELEHFAGIVACGMPRVAMTSIEELTGQSVGFDELAAIVVAEFGRTFGREMIPAAVESWWPRLATSGQPA